MGEEEQVARPIEARTEIRPSHFTILDPELIKYLLSNDPLLQNLEIKLSRLEFDPIKKVYFRPKDVKPICNKEAIKDFLAVLGSISDKGVILSNFTEDMINNRMIGLVDMFADLLELKLDQYNINEADLDMVMIILEFTAEAALRRAYKGEGFRGLSNSLERKEIITSPVKRGIFR